MDSQHIVSQTNGLARMFHALLGFSFDGETEFHRSDDPDKKSCWDMACIAQKELCGIDPNEHIPSDLMSIDALNSRILAASQDGIRNGGRANGG